MYDHLRKQNEKAYEPSKVAFGPYHHGKPNLQEMELHKLRHLRRFLNVMRKKWEFINSATELQEAGVQFKKAEGSNLFDIKFISGALKIPVLSITDYTESFLTNLVAFELCPSYHKPKGLLHVKLFKITLTNLDDFGYSEVFINVNNHCKRCRNMWIANLKRNYFNSPWAFISFLAATTLLLLTIAQTIFSILTFGKGSF
ncbi:uncharacterized protein LOC114265832 [Camellia sinensis]|uniref:uncharacterized protein LOC114265832 n=1 Tax=Camellia sinensis TaxID=4442 RepID=UPI001035C317|nr:uncharacterized protein LOC114265832 [Camellia sinensis]